MKKIAKLIQAWLQVSGVHEGRVFRRLLKNGSVGGPDISLVAIRTIIKSAAAEAGIEGRFSGNSLRVGAAKSLIENGASMGEAMQDGRWMTLRMVAHYASAPLAFRSATVRLRGAV